MQKKCSTFVPMGGPLHMSHPVVQSQHQTLFSNLCTYVRTIFCVKIWTHFLLRITFFHSPVWKSLFLSKIIPHYALIEWLKQVQKDFGGARNLIIKLLFIWSIPRQRAQDNKHCGNFTTRYLPLSMYVDQATD